MAGGSTSEEMDAFDDVTPDKPVSIYDLDEDLPTRAQSSDEIAEFQKLAREKREAAFRSFKPPSAAEDARTSSPASRPSNPSGRPIPRESGPVLIASGKPRPPVPAEPEPDFEAILSDVAAGLERLPPAPRVPHFEPEHGALETIHGPGTVPPAPAPRAPRWRVALLGVALLAVTAATAWAYFHPPL